MCIQEIVCSMVARVCVCVWKINLHFSECALIGRLSVVMTIINVLPIYVHKHVWGFRPPNISLSTHCIHVSVPIDAVFDAVVRVCILA